MYHSTVYGSILLRWNGVSKESLNFDVLGSSSAPAAAAGGPSGLTGTAVDSESDDSEVGRLQALLEARGLPPHLLGALGPRMQHLLHRSMGANSGELLVLCW